MLRNRVVPLAVLMCAVGVSAWRYMESGKQVFYKTAPVQRGEIRSTVSSTGSLSALITVQVGSQVSGNISALHADFNSAVHKGQLLAEIDPLPFQARVDVAQAAVDAAQAGVAAAQASVHKAQSDVNGAQAQSVSAKALVAQAVSSEQDAKIKYQSRLKIASTVVPEDLETARTTYEEDVANHEAATAQASAADSTIRSQQDALQGALEQVKTAAGQVKQAQALLDQANLDFAHTRITSPIDGIVISRDVELGQTVAASFQTPTLFEIAQDLKQMQVDANIDESDVSKLAVGQLAQFTVDAIPGQTFQAAIRQVRKSPVNVQNVITYDVMMSVPNPDLILFPGMTANLRIQAGVRDNILKLPNAALRYHPPAFTPPKQASTGQTAKPLSVFVLDDTGKPQPRLVQAGISDGTFTEISSAALHENDPVIVSESHSK